jgi:gluconokinase
MFQREPSECEAVTFLVVVMGVTASGKTTTATSLAKGLDTILCDADDLHPAANREKMSRGVPLTDDDRWPWLEAVRRTMEMWCQRTDGATTAPRCTPHVAGIMACSALKKAYRTFLRCGTFIDNVTMVFVYCKVTQDVALRRAVARAASMNHFVNPSIVASQFTTLQEPSEEEFDAPAGSQGLSCRGRLVIWVPPSSHLDGEDSDVTGWFLRCV